MSTFKTFRAPSGFVLPSYHAVPPFFTKQHHPLTLSDQTSKWLTLIMSYARYRRLWVLRTDDAELKEDGDWCEVFWNPRINRQMKALYLEFLINTMISEGSAFYEPPQQNRSVIVCWKRPEEWADVLFNWAHSTGQLNTILTHYEITNPEVQSELSDMPLVLLRRAINILIKSGRAQTIEGTEGGGVRFFQSTNK